MKTKTDIKAGYANTRIETPTLSIDRLVLPDTIGQNESFEERPFFKTGHTVAAILE
jgi:hypothetical protein